MNTQYGVLPQTRDSLSHILYHYTLFKEDRQRRGLASRPMMVGVSGCQGSGKTTLCDTLTHLLQQEPYNLRVVNFSLDDMYLTRQEQVALSKKYADNALYQQRGQAGSHDVPLIKSTFDKLLTEEKGKTVPIPVYDKSLHEGKGDRLPKNEWKYPTAPFDIILFEGWMLGFKPLLSNELLDKDTVVMNDHLKSYENEFYGYFDIFIHLTPKELSQVYQWRLQQEHYMKSTRGVDGLSDEQVKLFVDTYMHAYKLYLPRLEEVGFFNSLDSQNPYEGIIRKDGGYNEQNKHLKIVLDLDRKVMESVKIPQQEQQQQFPLKQGSSLFNKRFFYQCAFIGILGLIGFKRSNSILKLFKK